MPSFGGPPQGCIKLLMPREGSTHSHKISRIFWIWRSCIAIVPNFREINKFQFACSTIWPCNLPKYSVSSITFSLQQCSHKRGCISLFPSVPLPGQSDAGVEIDTSAAWLGKQIHFFKPVSPSYWRCQRQNQNNSQSRPARLLNGPSRNFCSNI